MGPEQEDFVWEICGPVLALGPDLVVPVLYWRAIESLATTKVRWIQIHLIWIRIQNFGPIWIRIPGCLINFEEKNVKIF